MATRKASATRTTNAKTSRENSVSKASTKQASTRKTAAKKAAVKKPARKSAASKSAASPARGKQGSAKPSAMHVPVAKSAKVPAKRSAPKKRSTADKYTDPALRDRIKAKVVREGKGGRPGQWSARKAQMVAHEYEAEGGKYKGGRDAQQKSLTDWGDEHWTTQDGKPARRKDGMHRYLPAEAWKDLSPAERRSTEKKKLAADKQGKQFVANTRAAVKARRKAEK